MDILYLDEVCDRVNDNSDSIVSQPESGDILFESFIKSFINKHIENKGY
jgi:hypothetical protein